MKIKKYGEFINENTMVNEKLISFSNTIYPKFGNVVIMAGSPGSGKSFQIRKMLGIEGKIISLDETVQNILKNKHILKRLLDKMNINIKDFDINNIDHVDSLYSAVGNDKILNKQILNFNKGKDVNKLPNIIFDCTLNNMRQFHDLCLLSSMAGYKKENIHIVWVISPYKNVHKQNAEKSDYRKHFVNPDVVDLYFKKVPLTMQSILEMGDDLKKYMDGDIWISFNDIKNDTKVIKSEYDKGMYVEDFEVYKAKSSKENPKSPDELPDEIREKIRNYTRNYFW